MMQEQMGSSKRDVVIRRKKQQWKNSGEKVLVKIE